MMVNRVGTIPTYRYVLGCFRFQSFRPKNTQQFNSTLIETRFVISAAIGSYSNIHKYMYELKGKLTSISKQYIYLIFA